MYVKVDHPISPYYFNVTLTLSRGSELHVVTLTIHVATKYPKILRASTKRSKKALANKTRTQFHFLFQKRRRVLAW